MKEICARHGYEAVSPLDPAPGVKDTESDNPYMKAMNLFDGFQQHVRNCDIIIANLNNYRGYETNNDVAFECGMGFELGKKLYGYWTTPINWLTAFHIWAKTKSIVIRQEAT